MILEELDCTDTNSVGYGKETEKYGLRLSNNSHALLDFCDVVWKNVDRLSTVLTRAKKGKYGFRL